MMVSIVDLILQPYLAGARPQDLREVAGEIQAI